MKKSLLLITACLLFGAFTNTFAQTERKNVFKVNIFSPIVRTGSFFYERAFTDKMTGQLGFYYTGFSAAGVSYRGFGITPEVRFYLSQEGRFHGFYVAPFLRYQNLTLTENYSDYNYDPNTGNYVTTTSTAKASLGTMGGGLLIGGEWLFANDRICLDAFIGPSYNAGTAKASDNGSNTIAVKGSFSGFGVRTGVCLGIAF